jgi:hypothetical protein
MNRLYIALVSMVACWAVMLHSQDGWDRDIMPPITVVKMSVDTVGLGTVSTVSISVLCWPKQVKNVTARIVPDSGFEIVRQPQEMYSEPDTGAVIFKGMIRAMARGIWRVGVEAAGAWPDTSVIRRGASFYVQISDSLCRAMTDAEYILLQSPIGKTIRIPNRDKVLYRGQPGKMKMAEPARHNGKQDSILDIWKADKVIDTTYRKKAEPTHKDSSTKKDSTAKKVSGTFDVIGGLLYHDPRDPQGQFQPAWPNRHFWE